VMASFASLGDLIVAEPKCMVGFAGPRVIRETTHQDLPAGFQTAEFLLGHGFIDLIVRRSELRPTLSQLLDYLGGTN
jgi:acetyl-CoA carboxylase carboxyl transferase subunit beta